MGNLIIKLSLCSFRFMEVIVKNNNSLQIVWKKYKSLISQSIVADYMKKRDINKKMSDRNK